MKTTNQISTADFFNQPLPREQGTGRRPQSHKKSNDFSSMLQADTKPRNSHTRKSNAQTTVTNHSHQKIKPSRDDFENKPQKSSSRSNISKPSRAIKVWGRKLAQQEGGLEQFPELSLLGTMNSSPEVSKQLPEMLSKENGFLARALGSNVNILMHTQLKISEIADMLGLSESFSAEAEKLGLNPEEVISPKQFFQFLGINPSNVLAKIDQIKSQLARDGLSSYFGSQASKLDKHTHKNKHHSQKNKESGLDMQSEDKPSTMDSKSNTLYPIKKLSESPELIDLWQAPNQAGIRLKDSQLKQENQAFTNLESNQLKSIQADRISTGIEKQNLQMPDQALHQIINTDQARSMSSATKTSDFQNNYPAEIQNGFLNLEPTKQKLSAQQMLQLKLHQAGPKPEQIKTPQVAMKQAQNQDEKLDLRKNTQHRPQINQSFANTDMLNLSKPKNIITDESLKPDLALSSYENIDHTKESSTEPVLHKQPLNTLSSKGQEHDFGLNLENSSVSLKQQIPKDSFEDIQRQLQSPFANEANNTAKENDFGSAYESQDATATPHAQTPMTRPNSRKIVNNLVGVTSRENSQIQAKNISHKLPELFSENDTVSQDSPKNVKQKSNSYSFEPVDLEQSLKVPDQLTTSPVRQTNSEMSPELSFEARQEMLDKISEQSMILNRQGGGRANIAISDKNIGDLSLAVQVDGNDVQIKMQSQTDGLRNILGQDLNNLKENLSSQNLNLVQVDVSSHEYGHESSNQGHNNYQLFDQQQRQNQFNDNPTQHGSYKSLKSRHEVSGANGITRNPSQLSHNLLSKHIQVAA